MFWMFILLVILGLTFVKLGSYSVWITVFAFGLKLFTLIFIIILCIFIWNKFLKPYFNDNRG